jgi:hypothetical protein
MATITEKFVVVLIVLAGVASLAMVGLLIWLIVLGIQYLSNLT